MNCAVSRSEIENVFSSAETVAEEVFAGMRCPDPPTEEDLPRVIMWVFGAKATKTYSAVHLLWHEGYTEDATMLGRTLFELEMQARYLQTDPINLAKRVYAFEPVLWYRAYSEKYCKVWSDVGRERSADMKQWKAGRDSYMAQYGKQTPYWWGDSIDELAIRCHKREPDRYWRERFAYFYGMSSDLVHSTTRCFHHYYEIDANIRQCHFPDEHDEFHLLIASTQSMVNVLLATADAFDLDSESAFRDIGEELCRLAGANDELSS